MPYRGPDFPRIQAQQMDAHYAYAAQPVIWRRTVSATGGVSVAGIGATGYTEDRTISALFRPLPVTPEQQTPAGMIAGTRFEATTRERLGRGDTVIWANVVYRVESVPVPATLHSGYVSVIVRGEP